MIGLLVHNQRNMFYGVIDRNARDATISNWLVRCRFNIYLNAYRHGMITVVTSKIN
jgi:hypothetical protein